MNCLACAKPYPPAGVPVPKPVLGVCNSCDRQPARWRRQQVRQPCWRVWCIHCFVLIITIIIDRYETVLIHVNSIRRNILSPSVIRYWCRASEIVTPGGFVALFDSSSFSFPFLVVANYALLFSFRFGFCCYCFVTVGFYNLYCFCIVRVWTGH